MKSNELNPYLRFAQRFFFMREKCTFNVFDCRIIYVLSGILNINIEGNDYLVKKGDVVNNYKVLCIAQDSVTVKLGENTYKAGIGEILTEGTLHHNDVSNLNNKFGGVREWVIVI